MRRSCPAILTAERVRVQEEEAAKMDAGTKETYGMVAAAVDGNGVEISTRADAQRTDA